MTISAASRPQDGAVEDAPALMRRFGGCLTPSGSVENRAADRVLTRLPRSRAFCQDIIDRTLVGEAFGSADARRRFFAWALARKPASKLLPVLACHDHPTRADTQAALAYAKRAIRLNQNDLYAQRLYRQCRPDALPEPDLRGRFCSVPFDKMETYMGGRVFFCCPAWLPVPIGNLNTQSPEAIWTSQPAQEIRRSILDGSYRYCSRMHRPKSTANTLPASRDITDKDSCSMSWMTSG